MQDLQEAVHDLQELLDVEQVLGLQPGPAENRGTGVSNDAGWVGWGDE